MLWSDTKEVLDISRRSPLRLLKALNADLKLLVEGGCLMADVWEGGMLDPWARPNVPRPPPGTESTEPKVGVVARWMSSGGGGEDGRGGGMSCERRSGMKDGGGMLPGGGGARGGGGTIIVGGRLFGSMKASNRFDEPPEDRRGRDSSVKADMADSKDSRLSDDARE